MRLSDNLISLSFELKNKTYVHQGYVAFRINDPKPRDIHKASVRDRLVHHAIHRISYPYFDQKFDFNSFSCRKCKGTHKALYRFEKFSNIVSKNDTRTCWVLKCDIRKFFANIDHTILKEILAKHIEDVDILWLFGVVIDSFNTKCTTPPLLIQQNDPGGKVQEGKTQRKKGLPLGNLTSQLLVNIYMNEFDQYMKRELKVKHYIRYADDFVILSEDKTYLENLLPQIAEFLGTKLKLSLHPDKVFIKTLASGVDFLGWVHFPNHRVLRTATKRRMVKNIRKNTKPETLASYKGMLSHGNGYKLTQQIERI